MADEITVSVSLALKNDDVDTGVSKASLKRNQTGGAVVADNVQTVTSVRAAMEMGAIASRANQWCYLENLDDEEDVHVFVDGSSDALIYLAPGDVALFRIHEDSSPNVKTPTNPANLRVVVFGA